MTLSRGAALGIAVWLGLAGPVAASCIFNKEICRAVCGSPCCANKAISTAADPDALAEIRTDDLLKELNRVARRRADLAYFAVLRGELESRGLSLQQRPSSAPGYSY